MTQVSALFEIDTGSGYGSPGVAQNAPAASVVNCRVASVSGVTRIDWRIFGTHGGATPTLSYSGNPNKQIATFTTAGGLGQSYGIECKVTGTGGRTDLKTSAVFVLDIAGQRPFFLGETFEENATHGVIPRLNTNDPIVSTSVPVAQTIYVDWKFGNGAVDENLGKPYQTLTDGVAAAAALTPAVDKQIAVIVQPGEYTWTGTLPSYVHLQSAAGRGVTTINADVATSPIVTMQPNSSISGFRLRGANGVGGAAVKLASVGKARAEWIDAGDCATGLLVSGAGSALVARHIEALRAAGETMGACVEAISGAVLDITSCELGGEAGAEATVAVHSDGSGSLVVLAEYNLHNADDGKCTDGGGRIVAGRGVISDCGRAIHIGPTGLEIATAVCKIVNSGTWDIYVENPAATLNTMGVSADAQKVNIDPAAAAFGLWLNDAAPDLGVRVEGELHVGSPTRPAESCLGSGDSHTDGMVCKTNTNGTIGTWADVTSILKSDSGSTTAMFAGTAAENSFYVGGYADYPDFGGLKMLVTAATVLGGSGEIVFEYSTGVDAWASLNWMTALANSPYTTLNRSVAETADALQVRFGPMPGWVAVEYDGATKKWWRARIVTAISTAATLEHVKLHTDRCEINADGFLEFFGRSRPWISVPILTNVLESAGGVPPTNQNLFPGLNTAIGMRLNRYNNNLTREAGIGIQVPVQTDTSHPLVLEVEWQSTTTSTGNMVWYVYAVPHAPNAVLNTSAPGALSEQSYSVTTAGPGVIGQGVVSSVEIDISRIVTSGRHTLELMIQRQGAVDAHAGDVIIRPGGIRADVLTWAVGRPQS